MNIWRQRGGMCFPGLVMLSVLSLASGCVKLEAELSLKENGGGQCEVIYTIAEQAISQVRSMLLLGDRLARIADDTNLPSQAFALMPFLDPSEDGLRRELKPYEERGGTIQELKVESRAGNRVVALRIAFQNLADLQTTPLFDAFGFSLRSLPQAGGYRFERSNPHVGWDPFPEELRDPGAEKALVPLMGGFSVQLRLRVPGQIVETNAPRKSRDMAIWVFDFDRDVYALPRLQTATLNANFTGRNLRLPELRQPSVAAP